MLQKISIPATNLRENYFSDLYAAKILELSAKPFFPCMRRIDRDKLRNVWINIDNMFEDLSGNSSESHFIFQLFYIYF